MAKISLKLRDKSTQEKVLLARLIVSQISQNGSFVSPNPALADVTAAALELESASAAYQMARKSLALSKSLVAKSEAALNVLLTQLGSYVECESKGDASVILDAGLNVKKDKSPLSLPHKIAAVKIVPSDVSGQITLSWKRIDGARSYVVQRAVDSGTQPEWQHAQVSIKSKAVVMGLVPGTSYQFRVAAVNSAGNGGWSNPIVRIAP
jgi:hypothetical protein